MSLHLHYLSCKQLTRLLAQCNDLSSIEPTPFLNLRKLKILRLDNNRLTEISNLPESLNQLTLSSNPLTDVKVLSKLTSLNELDLSDTRITSLEGMHKLTGLQELKLSGIQLPSLAPLSQLSSLSVPFPSFVMFTVQALRIERCGISVTSTFCKITSLTELYLQNNRIHEFSPPLQNFFPHLETLDVSGNEISDVQTMYGWQ